MDRWPYHIQSVVSPAHTSCSRQIPSPLFDLHYVLEIITFGNHYGPDAGPQTSLGPYILSFFNANGPTDVSSNGSVYQLKVVHMASIGLRMSKCN